MTPTELRDMRADLVRIGYLDIAADERTERSTIAGFLVFGRVLEEYLPEPVDPQELVSMLTDAAAYAYDEAPRRTVEELADFAWALFEEQFRFVAGPA